MCDNHTLHILFAILGKSSKTVILHEKHETTPPPGGEKSEEGHVLLENGCKKFHGHYSAANFSTPEFEFPREVESHTPQITHGQALRSGL